MEKNHPIIFKHFQKGQANMYTLENSQSNSLNNHSIKVLMYHKLVEDEKLAELHWTNLSVEQFHKHLILLDRWGFTPITFKDYLLYSNGDINLPKKPVIITFDDGYVEVYKYAFPILKEFGWNAVAFVLGDRKIKTNLWDQNLDIEVSSLLTNDQILKMHEAGFEIGSHSLTHARLNSVPLNTAFLEINNSKINLQSLLNSEVISFSYPYGALNSTIKMMVYNADYKLACGVFTGPPKFGEDKFDIRRITITNTTSSFAFALKILTPYEYYEWVGSKTSQSIANTTRKYSVKKTSLPNATIS